MGIDPLSIGLGLLGTGISAIGGLNAAGSASRNAAARNAARNGVLQEQLVRQRAYRDQNYKDFDQTMSGYSQPAQGQRLQENTDNRSNAQLAAINSVASGANDVPVSSSAPSVVSSEYAKRIGDALAVSMSRAKAGAALGGYGDQWNFNSLDNQRLGQKLDTTNNFARGQAALTSPLQDLAEFSVTKAPNQGAALTGSFGKLLTGAAGAGWFNPNGQNYMFKG